MTKRHGLDNWTRRIYPILGYSTNRDIKKSPIHKWPDHMSLLYSLCPYDVTFLIFHMLNNWRATLCFWVKRVKFWPWHAPWHAVAHEKIPNEIGIPRLIGKDLYILIRLVVFRHPSEKYESQLGWLETQLIWEHKKCSKPPTSFY